MIAGGVIAWFFGVNAERQSLEDIATPLSVTSRVRGGMSDADQPGAGPAGLAAT